MRTNITYSIYVIFGLIMITSCDSGQSGDRLNVSTSEIDSLDLIVDKNSADTLIPLDTTDTVAIVIPTSPPKSWPDPYIYPGLEPLPIVFPISLPTVDDTTGHTEQITQFPDIEASYPGGTAAMMKFVINNTRYPEVALEIGLQGRVYISFVVERDGRLTNVKIIRGISIELNREAIRVIRSMPNWEPAISKGKTVRSLYRLPISFVLSDI